MHCYTKFEEMCIRKPESGERFFVIDVGRADGGDHGRLRVAAQVLPQEPREHRVPVGDVVALLLLLQRLRQQLIQQLIHLSSSRFPQGAPLFTEAARSTPRSLV